MCDIGLGFLKPIRTLALQKELRIDLSFWSPTGYFKSRCKLFLKTVSSCCNHALKLPRGRARSHTHRIKAPISIKILSSYTPKKPSTRFHIKPIYFEKPRYTKPIYWVANVSATLRGFDQVQIYLHLQEKKLKYLTSVHYTQGQQKSSLQCHIKFHDFTGALCPS